MRVAGGRPPMARAAILVLAELARRHVAQGERLIARQQEIITELEDGGQDASGAKQMLASFQGILQLHIADRDRLEKELGDVSK